MAGRPVGTLSLLLLLLAACPAAVPADLTLATDSEPRTLDPARMSGVSEGRIANALFEGLTRLDPATMEPRPAAAEEWSVSDDGLVWTFALREDGRWSDGRPVTAADFRDSWLRLLDPATAAPYAGLLMPVVGARARMDGEIDREVVGIQAPDPRTLVVRLTRPVPYFAALTAFFSLFPVPGPVVARHGDRWTRAGNLVGNGPFVLREHRFYREILLERSGTWHGRVGTNRIRLLPVPDPSTQLNLFLTGQVDLTFSVPSSVVGRLGRRPDFASGPRLATAFLRLNVTRAPLRDPRVRRAFALAVDRRRLVTRITRGGELPAERFVPPMIAGSVAVPGPGHDPAAARKLLAEAGHEGGKGMPRLALLLSQNPDHAAIATVLQSTFRDELSIDLAIDVREWKVYLTKMKSLDYDLAFSQWIGDYPDPTTFLDCFRAGSGNNRTGFADPEYDELLDRAAAPAPGESAAGYLSRRGRLLAAAEERLLRQAPIVTLYHPTFRFLVSPEIRGFTPNAMGLVPFADLQRR